MAKDSVSWFLNQAGREPLLTIDEELILGRAVQEWQTMEPTESPTPEQRRIIRRGQRAKDRMFKANLRLVINVAKKYTKIAQHLELSDLIQEGNIGLNRAIEKFDPARGYKFSTYAYWWIRQGITRALTQCERTIRLPIHAVEIMTKLRVFLPEYQRQHGRMPSVDACMEHVGMKDAPTMRIYLRHMQAVTSLDARVAGDSENSTYMELLASDGESPWDYVEKEDAGHYLDLLHANVHMLAPKQKEVIQLRFNLANDAESTGGQDGFFLMTQCEVARRLGISRQAVSCYERRAFNVLRLGLANSRQDAVA